MMKPVIFDCDGVLLDWEAGFREWAQFNHGISFKTEYPLQWDLSDWMIDCCSTRASNLIHRFNHSESFQFLPAMPTAARVLYETEKAGRPIFVLTSCSSAPEVVARRQANLRAVFSVKIERVICLDLGVSKLETLRAFNTVFGECDWIEDNYKNAIDGFTAGHRSFFLHRPHNQEFCQRSGAYEAVIHLEHLSDFVSHLT